MPVDALKSLDFKNVTLVLGAFGKGANGYDAGVIHDWELYLAQFIMFNKAAKFQQRFRRCQNFWLWTVEVLKRALKLLGGLTNLELLEKDVNIQIEKPRVEGRLWVRVFVCCPPFPPPLILLLRLFAAAPAGAASVPVPPPMVPPDAPIALPPLPPPPVLSILPRPRLKA